MKLKGNFAFSDDVGTLTPVLTFNYSEEMASGTDKMQEVKYL